MQEKFRVSALGRAQRQRFEDQKKQSHWLRRLAFLAAFAVVLFLARTFVVLILLQTAQFVLTPVLPNIDEVTALYTSQSTIIYDREGSELYTIHGDENRFEIPFEKIPESVKLTTIAAEDDQFFTHPGFDVDGIVRAVLGELGFDYIGGGSTITQQFVKTAYLSPEKTYWRKLQELMLSLKFENKFTKNEILEMYLNRIPYGGNAYGIQAAAQTFFGKNAEDLSIAESAILAALPQRPSKYSPYGQNREFLMGSCGKLEEVENLEDTSDLKLKVKADAEVWLKVLVDGEVEKEGIFAAGEFVEFDFTDNFNIVSGNQSFQVLVNDEEISTNNQSNFTGRRADFAESEMVVAVACDSIDDSDYSPGRKDYVLTRMLDLGFIAQEEFEAAWIESNNVKFTSYREPIKAPHFVFFVRDLLEEQFGKDVVERGGLRVFTTLDPVLQGKAEELIAEQFPQTENEDGSINWRHNRFDATNAALLAVDNSTGQILTMVGSRDYFETLQEDGYGNDGATNLTTRNRQPGSSFKPFAYTAGLKQGYTPASVFWDVETNFGKGTDEYTPQNFDGEFLGPLSMRKAIGHSRNIPAVKMAILAGEPAVVETAHDLGLASVKTDGRYGPTIGLGAAEVPMLEMVRGYSVFANGGYLVKFTPILKVTDSRGNVIDEFEEAEQRLVLDPRMAYLMTNILSDSSARPSAWNGWLDLPDRPNAAKTGTANKRISEEKILPGDVWTIGYTPQITAAAWMGNNDGTPMNVSGTGLASASPVWSAFMRFVHADAPVKQFKIPEGVIQRSVSRLTGKIASDTTPVDQIVVETFVSSQVPLELDDAFVEIEVDAASGKLPGEHTPDSALIKKKFVNLHSERDYDPEWENPVREWLEASAEDTDTVFEPAPSEIDDLHTAETKKFQPNISIISPVSGSTVQKQAIGVWVKIAAPHGTEKVEYYRDDELVSTATAPPWKGNLAVPLRVQDGERVKIAAKVFDKLYYADTSSVEVIVGEDTQEPTVRITAPTSGQDVPRGATLLAKADAFDAGGDIVSVSFRLDGVLLKKITTTPYETPLIIRNSTALGQHLLEVSVTDTAGFTVSDSVSFRVTVGGDSLEDFSVVYPATGAVIAAGTVQVEVLAQINQAKFIPEEVEFIARNVATGARTTFARLDNLSGEAFSAVWEDFSPGEYEIYFKARDNAGKTIISGRNSVEVK